MISRGTGNPNDQPLYDRLWGSGFLPTTYQGIKFRSVGDPVLYLSNPPGFPPRPGGGCSTTCPSSTRSSSPNRRPGDRHADRAVRDGLPDADVGPRADRPLEASPNTSSTCTAPNRASPARSPPTACWPAGWPSGACGSSSSSTAAGTSTRTCPPRSPASAATPTRRRPPWSRTSKQRGLLDDTLVVWGGEFGRTVYCQGEADGHRLRPRPPSPLLHHLAGRRRHQARHDLRRDRRLRLQHRPATPSTSTTCTPRSCIAWGSTTRG